MLEQFNTQSLCGLLVVVVACWLLSEDKKRFPFLLLVGAIAVQAGLVLLLFGLPQAQSVLQAIGSGVDALGASARAGTSFVFGYLAGGPEQPFSVAKPGNLFLFGFQVLPVILVVCALAALLWHWRILKWLAKGFGFVFQKTMGLRGPPALAVAATVFMGQVEGPIFIRSYLDKLTRSELFMLLSVGMACVSGSTMVAYATILHDVLPNAAAHVLTASIISAPAGVLLARIIVPADRTERKAELDKLSDKTYDSSIDALMKGTGDGLQVVLNVGATLIVFMALVALANTILGGFADVNGGPLSVERILGTIFAPLAWCLGIPWKEAPTAGSLLGVKLVATEFSAFLKLGHMPTSELSERSRMIMTYALCGFANVASVGINVAGFSVLVPERRGEILGMIWKALVAGFLATCMTASVVGALPTSLFKV